VKSRRLQCAKNVTPVWRKGHIEFWRKALLESGHLEDQKEDGILKFISMLEK
jgi:hypothetical protein